MNSRPVILWFRQDLRLNDNPALVRAHGIGVPVVPVYILDDDNAGDWAMGGASRVWLHHSLHALNKDLNGTLACYRGNAADIIPRLVRDTGAQAVAWNRCYEPWRIKRDETIKTALQDSDIRVISENAALLYEPWAVSKNDGTPYRVFTPFFRRGCLGLGEPAKPQPKPKDLNFAAVPSGAGSIDDLNLLPRDIRWDKKMMSLWTIGEAGARQRLSDFVEYGLRNYKEGRNIPSAPHVSRLSPHLHFGEISPRSVWHMVRQWMATDGIESDGDHFLSELAWREFSHSLLYHNHTLPTTPLQARFNQFPWSSDNKGLEAWKRGMTGYPIVDAGMRELWKTGYMHNRVRMIVGSFLVKNLLIHWNEGEKWFWDCLFDADLANNAASWQWIAGCGADAAPYFRIFNPTSQGEKFDADGAYTRRWCPELAAMPNDYIHKPWDTPPMVLRAANVVIGATYPAPIVNHSAARERALAAFRHTKEA